MRAIRSAAPTAPPRLSPAELRAAALDGELMRVGDAYLFLDSPCGPVERAVSLDMGHRDPRVIICDRSAAWVWGWAGQPAALSTCVSIAARVPSPVRRGLQAREAVISDAEVRVLSTVRVTSPLRTVIDLVRHDPSDDVVDVVATALSVGGVSVESAMNTLLQRPGIAHVRRAQRRLVSAVSRC